MNAKWKSVLVAASILVCLLFVVAALAVSDEANPPNVTNPSASPSTIVNDGSEYTELTVDVVDDTAVDNVTIDLTPIGGKVVYMTCKANYTEDDKVISVFNYTTNATCSPGIYSLVVNTTDATSSRNYNNTEVITLTAGPVVEIEDGQTGSIGATTVVNITLDTAPNGLSGYNMTLSLSNTSIAEIISAEFPTWASINSNSTLPADTFWMKAADLMNQVQPGDTNINLGKLTIRGDVQGECNITAIVTKMDDDNGDPINPFVDPGQLKVASVIPLPGQVDPPTDPDGDGLYEDLNGNGGLDFDDVVQFFKHLEWIEANEPIACFDFNGNGGIDFDDIVRLFKEI